MSNEIELLVALGIDTSGSTTKNIQSQIDDLGKSLKGLDIKLDIPQDAIKALTDLSKVDLKGLNDALKGAKTGLGGVGEEAKQTGQEIKKNFSDVQKSLDATFAHLGQDFQKEMRKGITSVEDLEKAYEGMQAKFKYNKEFLGFDDDGRAVEAVKKVSVEYKNLQGQIEKTNYTLSNSRIQMGDGSSKNLFLPEDIVRVTDSQMKQVETSIARAVQSAQQELHKLVRSGEISEKQFHELSAAANKIVEPNSINLYNQRLTETISNNKQLTKEKKEQLVVEEKIRKLQNSIVSAQGKDPKGMGVNPEVSGMLNSLKQIDPASKGAANAVKGVSDNFDVMKAKSVEAGRSSLTVMESFKIAMEKFPIWMAASTAFYGTVRTMKEFGNIILDIDSKMTDLRKVMSDDTDFVQVFDRATQSAQRFGKSISETMDSYIEFARQGYKGNELGFLADAAVVASNVGDIGAQNAAELLTASLVQWKMESKDAMSVIDSWNEISNSYATTVQRVAEGQTRAGATARAMGLDFDQLNAVIGTVTASTKQSGREVGNFVKAVLPRLVGKPAQDALDSLDISLTDKEGNLRDIIQVYTEVAEKVKGISDSERIAVVEGLAGKYHISRMQALLDDLGSVDSMYRDMYQTSVDSAGSAVQENEKYMKSLEARMALARVEVEKLALAIGEAFLTEGMIQGIKVFGDALNSIAKLTENIGGLSIILGTLGTGLMLVSTRFKGLIMSMGIASWGALRGEITLTTVATRAQATAVNTLSKTWKGLLASTGVGLAFVGIGIALEAVIGKMGEARTKAEELASYNRTLAETYEQNKDQLDTLSSRYDELSKAGNISEGTKDHSEYLQVQEDIAKILPELVIGEDHKGRSILANSSVVSGHIELLKERLEIENELKRTEKIEESQDRFASAKSDAKDAKNDLESILDSVDTAVKSINQQFSSQINLTDQLRINPDTIKSYDDVVQKLSEVNSKKKELKDSDENYSSNPLYKYYDEMSQSLSHYMNNYNESFREQSNGNKVLQIETRNLISLFISGNEQMASSSKGLASEILNAGAAGETSAKKLQSLQDIAKNLSIGENLESDISKVDEAFNKLTTGKSEDFEKLKRTFDDAFAVLKDNILKDSGLDEESKNYKVLSDSIDKAKEAKLSLFDAALDLSKQEKISIEDAINQIKNTEDYADAMEDAAKETFNFKDALEQLTGVSEQAIKDTGDLLFLYEELAGRTNLTAEETALLAETQSSLLALYPEIVGESFNLINVYEELSKKKNLTSEETNLLENAERELLALHPELISAGISRVDMMDLIIGKILEETKMNDIYLAAMKAKRDGSLTAEEETTLGQLQNVNARIENINTEIKALSLLAQNYNKISAANRAAQTALSLLPGTEVFRAGIAAMDKGITFNFENQQAKLAGATAERIRLTDILSKSNEVMSRTTSDANKTAKESAEKNLKDAKAKEKGSKATKDATKNQKDYNTELQKSIYLADTFREAQEKINLELAKQNEIKAKNVQHSVAYLNALQKELEALHEKKNLIKEESASIREQIATGNIKQTGIVKYDASSTGGSSTQATVWNFFKAKGLSDNAVAGIMGNVQAESNFNPKAVNKSSGASGIFQWLGTRKNELMKYAKNVGKSWQDLSVQLEFAWKELSSSEKKAMSALKNSKLSAKQQAAEFDRLFERSEGTTVKKRQTFAQTALSNFMGTSAQAKAQQASMSAADYYLNNSAFKFSSGFGKRPAPKKGASTDHMGIDLTAKKGTDIKAVRGGKVIANAYHDGAGNYVNILQDDGLVARYLHMDKAPPLKKGAVVKAGDSVGKVGSTGISTGNHLHFEIRDPNKRGSDSAGSMGLAQDPLAYLKKQTEGISSGSQAVAEFAKSIDDLKSDLNSKSMDIFSVNEEIRKKSAEITEALLSVYSVRRNDLQNVIDFETTKLQTLDIESERYGKTIDKIMKQQAAQQRANKDELTIAQELIDSKRLSAVENRKLQDRVWALKNEIINLDEAMKATSLEKLNVELRKMDEVLRKNNYEFERSTAIMALYEEGSKDYNVEAKKQIELLKEEQKAIANKRDFLQKSLLTENLSIEAARDLGIQIEELSLAYWKLSGSIQNAEKSLAETNKKMAEDLANKLIDIYKSVVSERRDSHMRQLEAEVDAENDRHDATMKAIEREVEAENERHDAVKKQYDYEIEMEDKRHKKRMDAINKEFRAFERYVQAQLQEIDRTENTRTYDKDISKLQEERNEVQNKYNQLAGDDSYEAKAKRKELADQLKNIDEQLFERRNEREIELRKDNYDDLLQKEKDKVEQITENEEKLHEDTLDRIKDKVKAEDELHESIIKNLDKQKKAEDETHKNRIKNINDAKKYWDKYYEDQINNEREFERIKKAIAEGTIEDIKAIGEEYEAFVDEMLATMPELEDTLNGTMKAVGTEIRKNLIDNIKEAIQLLNEFNSKKNTSSPAGSNTQVGNGGQTSSTSGSKMLSSADLSVLTGKFLNDKVTTQESDATRKAKIKEKAYAMAASGRADGSEYSSNEGFDSILSGLTKEQQRQLGNHLATSGIRNVSSDYLQDYIREFAKRLSNSAASFDTGGFTGSWEGNSGKVGILHKEELILNQKDTSKFAQTMSIFDKMHSLLTTPQINMKNSTPQVIHEGDINIDFNVDKMTGGKDDVRNFTKEIGRTLKREKGKR